MATAINKSPADQLSDLSDGVHVITTQNYFEGL